MPENQYITNGQFVRVLTKLNVESMSSEDQQDLLDRATAGLEADLADKFVVPLVTKTGSAYSECSEFGRNFILQTLMAKTRQLIGYDVNRAMVIESTEKFIDTHGIEYNANIKKLHDDRVNFSFKILGQAQEAREEIQSIGLARPNNVTDNFSSDGDI